MAMECGGLSGQKVRGITSNWPRNASPVRCCARTNSAALRLLVAGAATVDLAVTPLSPKVLWHESSVQELKVWGKKFSDLFAKNIYNRSGNRQVDHQSHQDFHRTISTICSRNSHWQAEYWVDSIHGKISAQCIMQKFLKAFN